MTVEQSLRKIRDMDIQRLAEQLKQLREELEKSHAHLGKREEAARGEG